MKFPNGRTPEILKPFNQEYQEIEFDIVDTILFACSCKFKVEFIGNTSAESFFMHGKIFCGMTNMFMSCVTERIKFSLPYENIIKTDLIEEALFKVFKLQTAEKIFSLKSHTGGNDFELIQLVTYFLMT